MYVLAFDTAMAACSVAVARCSGSHRELLAHRYEARTRGHAEVLNGMIDDIMHEAQIGFDALGRIAVTTGPGTFTGVRIGVAAGRGMALALDVPCLGISTLEAIARGAAADLGGEANLGVVSDARRGELYVQCFTHAAEPLTEASVMVPAQAAGLFAQHGCAVVGTGVRILAEEETAANLNLKPGIRAQPDAAAICFWAAEAPPPEAPPVPLYLRAPDAKLPKAK